MSQSSNPDRHIDNLLLRRSDLDGRWTFIAIDWGKALWNSGFPLAPVEHDALAHLEWRGLAEARRAEDEVVVVFKEGR